MLGRQSINKSVSDVQCLGGMNDTRIFELSPESFEHSLNLNPLNSIITV